MLTLLWLWPVSALITVLLYAAVSFWFDGKFSLSEWIKLWLLIMVVLGPVGTLLSLRFLCSVIFEVHRETRRLKQVAAR
ncbi:hypothetical protein SAMN05660860_02730 [Geoalkalibacter ferrihydriticus]|uniref:Uncharacterized protein n=2 Tax=Geoalkalibacter ferrihydriticus TaxID=392333 RepID=A0A0C2HLP4_9BACT|nr:hypothetical protein [Geoalkalibacter ferrihydriticus]KIH75915.1 hypothetical protein GFER_13440 [Geoalkalibacter ferrihydriticus DSM 17813]SDM55181.1 hypothetical protein SAMN05660860_02730 [Geoalkalibacter ferrihydriticus]